MALASRPGGSRREWSIDARDDGRRMELTWHRHQRLVVLSLWQGGTCRATFRLRVGDAPRVIALLSSFQGDALVGAEAAAGGATGAVRAAHEIGPAPDDRGRGAALLTRRGASGRYRAVLERARQRWQQVRARGRTRAEVVDLTSYLPR